MVFAHHQYADELLRDLEKLDGWPEKVRTMQRNWIGRSEGTLVDFKLDYRKPRWIRSGWRTISVFTTRVDTIFGATSVQLAPQHPIVADLPQLTPISAPKSINSSLSSAKPKKRETSAKLKSTACHRPLCYQSVQQRKDSDLGGQLHPHGLRYWRNHERARA